MARLRGTLLFFATLLLFLTGLAQTSQIQSLTQELKKLEGEEYYTKANDLARLHVDQNVAEALELTEATINASEIENFPEQLARAHYIKGRALIFEGEYAKALEAFSTATSIIKTSAKKALLGEIYVGQSTVFSRQGKYTEAEEGFKKALVLLEQEEHILGLAECHLEYGKLEAIKNEHDLSKGHYDKSLEYYQGLSDEKGISAVYYRIAVHYLDVRDEEKALEYFTNGRAIKERIGDVRGLANFNLSLGILHEEKGNFETSLEYYRQSLEGYETVSDKSSKARVYNNIGVAYVDWNKLDSALVNHKKSLQLHEELQAPIGLIRSNANLGEVYLLQKEYDDAISYYLRAKKQSEVIEGEPLMGLINENLGLIYIHTGRLDSAAFYLERDLKLKQGQENNFTIRHTYEYLSLLEEKRGNFDKALEYYKLYKEVADRRVASRRAKELAEIQAKYDTERQEKEIAELQQENEKRTLWRNIFALGTLGALAIALLVFQFFRYRNKKNNELLLAKETQRQELEKLDQLKSRFFNNISHEFRTPLTLILGPLDKLRQNVDNGLQPTIDVIERNGKRLLKLINQLLDLSKIESGKVELKTTLADIVPLIRGWVMSFESLAESKGVKLDISSENTSYFLYLDQPKIEKVVINLLSNAFKYTPPGGSISVDLSEKQGGEHKYLSIRVKDTGSGIPEAELEHIFDRFYQASNAETVDVTGTGIGLSLIKELVELHSGEVGVESVYGEGSVFEIMLPLGREHLEDEQIAGIPSSSSLAVQNDLPLQPETRTVRKTEIDGELPIVLLIEDNPDLRGYIREILENTYNVIEARHGEEGVAMAFEHIPDLILSDLMMPKMDGLEVCKVLKEDMRSSHIPIILLTAKSSKEDKIEGLKSLADDYLTKPFDTEELLIRLQNLIDNRRKMQAHFSMGDVLMPKKVQMNSMDTIFMEKVTEHLEAEISNSLFGVEELAYSVGLSRSQLFRKIKAITNLTANEFIRSFRLHRAMDLLKQQSASVSEVAYETGFQNPSYFSKVFHEQFGQSPSAVLKE
ncbi:MAG: tetratricopeptide repeat protein [Flavobacteriaceae bacterium]